MQMKVKKIRAKSQRKKRVKKRGENKQQKCIGCIYYYCYGCCPPQKK
jgi:hypothetical protein